MKPLCYVRDNHQQNIVKNSDDIDLVSIESPVPKPGVKRQILTGVSLIAIFRLLTSDVDGKLIDEIITSMIEKVYNYFTDNYGTVDSVKKIEKEVKESYKEFSKPQEKKELKQLEPSTYAEITQIIKRMKASR